MREVYWGDRSSTCGIRRVGSVTMTAQVEVRSGRVEGSPYRAATPARQNDQLFKVVIRLQFTNTNN